MGQVSRVDSARLAVLRAGEERARGCGRRVRRVLPLSGRLTGAGRAGVRAVVQPGGSMRDDEVKAAAEAAGVTMYFTNTRHFFH